MRNRFDEELFELNREMIEMGALCEETLQKIIAALTTGDLSLAEDIKKKGVAVDQKERAIEDRCMRLLLHRQPVAGDLRTISAALKMITDMERIGDQAEDIAEILPFLEYQEVKEIRLFDEMAHETMDMVTKSVDAFVKKDITLAEKVLAQDDVVDSYFLRIKSAIIRLIIENKGNGESVADLLMVAKYFERIGDHATNIAEWVIYSVTGKHEEA